MVTCFKCGENVDVLDRYCRWCGRTFIPENYGPPRKQNVDLPVLLPSGRHEDRINDPEYEAIALALMKGIFHDDEDELNDVMDLISHDDPETDINQGY